MSGARTTRAAILVAQNEDLVVDEIELPEALAPGQVLVELHTSGICGSQLGEIDGVKGPDRHLPHLLGHEGCGTVAEIGPGVRHVTVGDRVVLHWRKGAGIEAAPPTYKWRGKPLNAGWVTTFNERAIVSENRLTPIAKDFDPALAALFGCPVTTGLGVVANDAKLGFGESIVVLGVGGVGLSIIQGAALASANPIVAVDKVVARVELAEQLGAGTGIVAPADVGELTNRIRQAVGVAGADAVVETTGAAPMITLACELTQPKGRTVLVGVPDGATPATIHTLPLHLGKTLVGSHGGDAEPARDIPRYVGLCESGKLDLAPLVTDRFKLDEINQAIAKIRSGEAAGRCVIELSPLP